MIRLITELHGRPLLIFGITQGNVARMAAGNPMKFDVPGRGDGPITVVLTYGDDEEAIVAELELHGVLPYGARQRVDQAMRESDDTQEFIVYRHGPPGPDGSDGSGGLVGPFRVPREGDPAAQGDGEAPAG